MDCKWCGIPHISWRFDDNIGKSRQWDNNLERWHNCKKSPKAIKEKKDQEFLKERQRQLLEEKQLKIAKLKTPVFCVKCEKSFKPIEPCQHAIKDGFRIGLDGSDFYADSFSAKQRRKYLKKQLQEKLTLDSFK